MLTPLTEEEMRSIVGGSCGSRTNAVAGTLGMAVLVGAGTLLATSAAVVTIPIGIGLFAVGAMSTAHLWKAFNCF
jgi:hypothetical protein